MSLFMREYNSGNARASHRGMSYCLKVSSISVPQEEITSEAIVFPPDSEFASIAATSFICRCGFSPDDILSAKTWVLLAEYNERLDLESIDAAENNGIRVAR